jgi:general stress protein 26
MPKKSAAAGAPKAAGSVKKLRKLMKNIRVAMLTTTGRDGRLRSRPMMTSDVEVDGNIWFIAKATSGLADEVSANPRVNVAFANPKNDRYVSVAGDATLRRDPDRIKQLWSGKLKAWFPEGKKDPELTLLCVHVDTAEYWDADSASMVAVSAQDPTMAPPPGPPPGDDATGAGAQG